MEQARAQIHEMMQRGIHPWHVDLQNFVARLPAKIRPAVLNAPSTATGHTVLEDVLLVGPRHVVPALLRAGARASLAAVAAEPAADPWSDNVRMFPAGQLTKAFHSAYVSSSRFNAAGCALELLRTDCSPPETGSEAPLALLRSIASVTTFKQFPVRDLEGAPGAG